MAWALPEYIVGKVYLIPGPGLPKSEMYVSPENSDYTAITYGIVRSFNRDKLEGLEVDRQTGQITFNVTQNDLLPSGEQYTVSLVAKDGSGSRTTVMEWSFIVSERYKLSVNPSQSPSRSPSEGPSQSPSRSPLEGPSRSPSEGPSQSPSGMPNGSPSELPTVSPTHFPSVSPTLPSYCSNRVCKPYPRTVDIKCVNGSEWRDGSVIPNRGISPCKAITECDSETEWETSAPTSTSDRSCAVLSPPCNASTEYEVLPVYIDGGHSNSSDVTSSRIRASNRKCAPLTLCIPGEQYQTNAPLPAFTDRKCASTSRRCGPGNFELSPPSLVADRLCERVQPPCETRDTPHYEVLAPTATSDRICLPITTCDHMKSWEIVPPTNTSDRICSLLTKCSEEQYESVSPTATSNRKCSLCTLCKAGWFVKTSCGGHQDTVCSRCTACAPFADLVEYEHEQCTANHDTRCNPITPRCGPSEFEVAGPTPSSDRVCTPVRKCHKCPTRGYYLPGEDAAGVNRSVLTESRCMKNGEPDNDCCAMNGTFSCADGWVLGTHNDRSDVCFNESSFNETLVAYSYSCYEPCVPEYEISPPGEFTDRVCKTVSKCDSDTEFVANPATAFADIVCNVTTVCQAGEYEAVAPTDESDRSCLPCDGVLGYQDRSGQLACTPVTACIVGSQFESSAPTQYSDRVCTNYTECSTGQWEVESLSTTSDRVCASHSSCITGVQYEVVPATNSSDRICNVISKCNGWEWESSPPTNTSDRICEPVTFAPCPDGQYQAMPANGTRDRVCLPWTKCNSSTEFIEIAGTRDANQICKPVRVCANDTEFEVLAPTSTSDRVCSNLRTCDVGSREITPPTSTSDRVCVECNGKSEYQDVAGQSLCKLMTVCDPVEQYQVPGSGSRAADRPCLGLTAVPLGSYEVQPPTPTTDRKVEPCSTCSVTEYEVRACSPGTNRQCREVSAPCDGRSRFEMSPPTRTSDRVCKLHSRCKVNEWMAAPGDNISDTKCRPFSDCLAGTFVSGPASPISDRECTECARGKDFSTKRNEGYCTPCTRCFRGQGQLTACTAISDTVCTDCWPGNYSLQLKEGQPLICKACPSETFAPFERMGDCIPAQTCDRAGFEEAVPPTASTDRVCRECLPGFYRTTKMALVAPGTSCQPHTNCTEPGYIRDPASPLPSTIFDRVCKAVEAAVGMSTFEPTNSTAAMPPDLRQKSTGRMETSNTATSYVNQATSSVTEAGTATSDGNSEDYSKNYYVYGVAAAAILCLVVVAVVLYRRRSVKQSPHQSHPLSSTVELETWQKNDAYETGYVDSTAEIFEVPDYSMSTSLPAAPGLSPIKSATQETSLHSRGLNYMLSPTRAKGHITYVGPGGTLAAELSALSFVTEVDTLGAGYLEVGDNSNNISTTVEDWDTEGATAHAPQAAPQVAMPLQSEVPKKAPAPALIKPVDRSKILAKAKRVLTKKLGRDPNEQEIKNKLKQLERKEAGKVATAAKAADIAHAFEHATAAGGRSTTSDLDLSVWYIRDAGKDQVATWFKDPKYPVGTYLVRKSSRPGNLVLCVKDFKGSVKSFLIPTTPDGGFVVESQGQTHRNLPDAVAAFTGRSFPSAGRLPASSTHSLVFGNI